ncbi:MAG TPA: DNA recombination protein RmuC [Rhodocyclaceae bacterium]|jgi:DNA recombination protein RmuC|nr:DNA recombination protein RmuC [Rhodocyclaceae bacterium]HMV21324.1 DNA recombination protein RmuC [Rhodocyclaceae bacterium]HMW78427.1 DNA recombination protein RmuC [Rhodocyclaceae bacterium]HNE41920.1 DNA recombination protein RmuC [Rhodocyclaceae bacterium]HNM21493.1 DNA recombination protein RmuC [Rhodocyclaceae bacterium]
MTLGLDIAIIAGLGAVIVLQILILQRGAAAGRAGEAALAELVDAQTRALERLERELREELARGRREEAETAFREREEQARSASLLSQTVTTQLTQLGSLQGERLEGFARELNRFSLGLDERFERLKGAVEGRLVALQAENSAKLEAMRQTVDEKLHATLEQRLGESFKQVSDRLEQVHRGLGEMHSLAAGVGDLKRVLTNVKTRGTWGEVQLAALLEQLLTADQFSANVATRPGSGERVDFAIRLPGKDDGASVWLPLDAKFPIEDWQRLLDAQERSDPAAMDEAAKAIEGRLKIEARSIREKYVSPPHTTDFAILYLPVEGLYAEALRRPGLTEMLQREWRISLAGPTTLAALLNSLQMGFRTLAIEQRSAEVWSILGAVKTEFGKFGEALSHTRKKLEEASSSIGKAETRTRVLSRKLKDVEALPAAESERLIGEADFDADAE